MKGLAVLLVTLLMLVRPLWPVFEYVMNYDYIVNVLCENRSEPQLKCDGKCYLAKQLSKESEKNQENPFGENQVKEIPQVLNTAFDMYLDNDSLFFADASKKFWPEQNLNSLLFVFKKIQPPKI